MKPLTKAEAQKLVRKIEIDPKSMEIFSDSLSPVTLTAILKQFLAFHGARIEFGVTWSGPSDTDPNSPKDDTIKLMRSRSKAKWLDDV